MLSLVASVTAIPSAPTTTAPSATRAVVTNRARMWLSCLRTRPSWATALTQPYRIGRSCRTCCRLPIRPRLGRWIASLRGCDGPLMAPFCLVSWALRMSPDRVIVGEVRGEEVLPMLNAMSQGNDGSMCTVHAGSSRGAFGKLATYAIQAPERLPLEATNLLIANAINLVVFIHHDRHTRRRTVASVREVNGAEGALVTSNEIFKPGPGRRAVPGAPLRAETLDALVDAGFDPGLLERREGWWDAPDAWADGVGDGQALR